MRVKNDMTIAEFMDTFDLWDYDEVSFETPNERFLVKKERYMNGSLWDDFYVDEVEFYGYNVEITGHIDNRAYPKGMLSR